MPRDAAADARSGERTRDERVRHAPRGGIRDGCGDEAARLGRKLAERGSLAAVGLTGYALGVVAVMALLPHPTRRQLLWAGPRVLALWTGGAWWAVAVAASAVDAASDHSVFGGRWLVVLVIGGYAQILWGSLAYLLPMLRGGGHQLLGEGFATTRSWVGLAAANAAALSAALALPTPITIAAVAVWVLDGAWRAARVGTTRATRPT